MKVFLFLCFLVFLATAEKQKPFKSVVSHLQDYSSATGGFTLNKRELPSLEATYYALQLATLYGTRQQLLKHIDVTPFIETLQNGDFGYGRRPGVASDLTSLRQAVFSYKLMGYAVPDADKAATYVKSLLNKATGLFANRVEEEGSIQATAFALQVLEALGELKEKPSALQSYLKTATVGDHFNTDSDDLNELADNYFALVVASLVNHKIDNPSKWATYILNKQDKTSGGFGSFQETAYAVASLKLLSQDKENFVDKLALDSLYNYAQTASDDLRDLVFAHLAVAPTKKFQENFDIVISYQAAGAPIKGDIVQGTLFKPVLSVKNHNGAPHSGLDANVVVSFAGTTLLESELQFQEDHKQYVSEQSVDTTGKLGVFVVKVVGSVFVPGFGDISLRVTDNKRVGYGIVVDSRAFSDVTGKEISEGDAVSVGTDFKFTVTLHNKTVHNLLSGDFAVDFKFLDSSNAVIASSKKDAKNNKDAVVFQYTLKSAAIPAGQLSFSFEVANKEGVHTKHVVKYLLNIPMIASQIAFDQSSTQYKIGDKVRISAVPANYPDLRSVTPLESKDAAGKEISRSFFLDVHSPHGLLLKSVQGVPNKGKLNFEVDVENTMDLIGNNAVSFRYQPAEGASIPLANYDSQLAELYQDSFVLNFTVNADLYVSNLKGTVKNELFYGNQVEFNFTLQDGLTKKVVKAGKQEKANVYLLLQHKDEDRPKIFTSSQHAATQVGDAFSLSYTIDPNAVQGPGILAIIAQGPDGNTLPVYKSGSGKQELKYDVTIGGKIDFQSKTFTQSSVSNKLASLFHETSFVVEFSLSCQDKVLKDAVLKCNVSTKSGFSSYEPLFSVPVATSKDGVYSTSWILPHEQPTTDYILQCYREIDRIRALESKEFKEKRKRKEKEAKGENPNDVPEEPLVLTPFFEIPVHHQSQDSFKLPIRTEVLVTSILAAGFVAAYYKMSVYTTSK